MHHQTKRAYWFQLLLLSLLVVTGLTQATIPATWQPEVIQHGQQIQAGQTPDGLSALDWASIQHQINTGKYRAYPNPAGGYNSSNPVHGWQIRYTTNGTTTLTPLDTQTKAYRLGMTLSAIGYQTLQPLDHPQQINADDNTVIYQWNNNLKEWWVNSPTRLEQWFSIEQRPAGATRGQPLKLQMTLDSELQVSQSNNSIHFTQAAGTSITYNKLKVWDATGRALPARMQLANNLLNIIIEESDANYPLTIDPSFQQQAYLKASNAEGGDVFGFSVAISSDSVVIGAPSEASNATGVNGDQSNNSADAAGAAYVFIRSGTGWIQQAYLKASNTEGSDQFGISVAITGDTVVVGAFSEASNATGVNGDQSNNSAAGAGAAYVFTRSDTSWSQQAYLKASNAEVGDLFGFSVAITSNSVVIGAPGEASNSTTANGDENDNSASGAGAAYVFTRSGTSWSQQAYLKASNAERGDVFGFSVAITSDTIVIGAFGEASNATTINGDENNNSASVAGAAYVFTRSGTSWSQQAYLKASNAEGSDLFGISVAITGNSVVIGAASEGSNATTINGDENDNSASGAGAAYVFIRNGTSWSQQAYLKASNAEGNDQFGVSVAISGDTVLVGASNEASNTTTVNGDENDNSATGAGAAYVFLRSGTSWNQQVYLKASNAEAGDQFGASVAITNDTIVIGALSEASNAITVNGDENDNSATGAGAAYVFRLQPSNECTLDVDGNVSVDALTDGLLFIRHMFGIRGESLIKDAVANNCINCTAPEIEIFLDQCAASDTSDIDGNGEVDALTDGLLTIRFIFGIRGAPLIEDSVGNGCSRCSEVEIEGYLEGLIP